MHFSSVFVYEYIKPQTTIQKSVKPGLCYLSVVVLSIGDHGEKVRRISIPWVVWKGYELEEGLKLEY